VILGQDPYHDEGQAHGLAFSVPPGVRQPPSLANIFKELCADVGCSRPESGCLIPWADQGGLLLNSVLTVRAHEANSHKGKGWERFTDRVIRHISGKEERVVFLLWGGPARAKADLIDTRRHVVIEAAHPSPLSASRGFLGSRPFSRANCALAESGQPPIDWAVIAS
jgi:uracil-DNA glycosylase